MKLLSLIEFFRRHLRTIVRISFAVLALLIAIDAIPALVNKEHAHTAAEHIPGFWSAFGFVACVLIVIGSKAFGHGGIMTREDYYDR